MGKHRHGHHKGGGGSDSKHPQQQHRTASQQQQHQQQHPLSPKRPSSAVSTTIASVFYRLSSVAPFRLLRWICSWKGIQAIWLCFAFGSFIGFIVGCLHPERIQLGCGLRKAPHVQFLLFRGPFWDRVVRNILDRRKMLRLDKDTNTVEQMLQDPSNPIVFALLREAVVRERGGYVNPDLGFLHPAPSGAVRGIGMVKDSFYKCQSRCYPASEEERQRYDPNGTAVFPKNTVFRQEEVLIRVPLSFQMTRKVAMDRLTTLIPLDVQRQAGMLELDDAALLVLLLAHERGEGPYSRWMPYIASLPPEPTCGYSRRLRPQMLDALEAYRHEIGVDTEGWNEELVRAMQYGEKIAEGLYNDYGAYLKTPDGVTGLENIQWALCQVASRATAASDKHGSLRLIPMLDLINHDLSAGGFVELTGKESIEESDFVNATEADSGTFVVRSLRHGRRKPLKKGQELLVNYNVPHYTPLDWFISLGFIPPERWTPWVKIDPVLPALRSDGPFADMNYMKNWEAREAELEKRLKNIEL